MMRNAWQAGEIGVAGRQTSLGLDMVRKEASKSDIFYSSLGEPQNKIKMKRLALPLSKFSNRLQQKTKDGE